MCNSGQELSQLWHDCDRISRSVYDRTKGSTLLARRLGEMNVVYWQAQAE